MSYSKQLGEKLARLSTELRAIVATAKADGNRGLTVDEQEKFAKLEADYTAIENSIKNSERIDAIENDLRTVPKDKIAATMGEEVYGAEAEKENKKLHNQAFSKYLRFGMEGLDAAEKRFFQMQFRGAVNPGTIKNAQTLTTTGGGYLIPQGFSDQLEEALKWYGGILGEVDEFTTESGNPMPWPTENDTANKGRILAVNTQVTETDLVFGQVTFNAYIFTSDSILVPLALIEDSYFNLDTHIAKVLGTRLGRLLNNKMTVGSGTNEPNGIQTATIAAGNTTQGASGETTSLIYTDLVDTMHLVDPAYRALPSCKWMFHDSTLKALRLLKDTAGRPLWQPGLTAGFGQPWPETILDKPYVVNQQIAALGASAYSLIFGALNKFKVRVVAAGGGEMEDNAGKIASGISMLRLVERYADYLQVGFTGFIRYDSNLIDAGTHPIGVYQNSAT